MIKEIIIIIVTIGIIALIEIVGYVVFKLRMIYKDIQNLNDKEFLKKKIKHHKEKLKYYKEKLKELE